MDAELTTNIKKEIDASTLMTAFKARLEIAAMDTKELAERYRRDIAGTLLSAGITLIPSDHLNDNQFVVSRGVYEAAKKHIDK